MNLKSAMIFSKLRILPLYFTRRYICTGSKYMGSNNETKLKSNDELIELHKDDALFKSLISIYPTPKGTLNNYHSNLVRKESNKDFKISQSFESHGQHHKLSFLCKLKLEGPIEKVFTGYAQKKKRAEAIACLKAISALYEENLMTHDGNCPENETRKESSKKYGKSDIRSQLRIPLPLSICSTHIMEVKDFILKYKETFQTRVRKTIAEYPNRFNDDDQLSNKSLYDLITGKSFCMNDNSLELLPSNTFNSDTQYKSPNYDSFQINSFREQIIKKIEENQVVMIEGGTGCGKSTQVPQIIYDHWMTNHEECNIVVTQPDRIVTINLSSFISKEKNEKMQTSVGYKIRFDQKLPRSRNSIAFYTSESLLQMMNLNRYLDGITHIIIDEIHECISEIDIVLCLLKNIIQYRPNLKVILMSATMDTNILSEYFGVTEESLIKIPGHKHHVELYNVENLDYVLGLKDFSQQYLNKLHQDIANNRFLNHDAVAEVIRAIHTRKPPGAILVFVPRWSDIKILLKSLSNDTSIQVLPLHSMLSPDKQQLVFEIPDEGQRKVILATNTAETITIKDIIYVVDLGLQNHATYKESHGMKSLRLHFIAQANAIQRAGRAGRVQDGEVYRLYSQEMFDSFDKEYLPEIFNENLESIIIHVKSLIPNNQSIYDFFGGLPDPPHSALVNQAIKNLVTLGILEVKSMNDGTTTEILTPIGKMVNKIPTTPEAAKSLIYGYFFRCISPILNVVALENGISRLFELAGSSDESNLKSLYDVNSDVIASSKLMNDTQFLLGDKAMNSSPHIIFDELYEMEIRNRYHSFKHVRDLLDQSVNKCFPHLDFVSNHGDNRQVILCSLLASSLTIHRRLSLFNNPRYLFSDFGSQVDIHRSSTVRNYESCIKIADLLLCSDLYYSEETRHVCVRNVSMLNSLAVPIFYGPHLNVEKKEDDLFFLRLHDRNLVFEANNETTQCIVDLRNILNELVNFMVCYDPHYPSIDTDNSRATFDDNEKECDNNDDEENIRETFSRLNSELTDIVTRILSQTVDLYKTKSSGNIFK